MTRAWVAALVLAAAPARAEEPAREDKQTSEDKPAREDKPREDKPSNIRRAVLAPFMPLANAMEKERPAPRPTDDRTAANVANAPLPGRESGRVDKGERDSTLRNVGQTVLFVPRVVLEAAFAPVRGGLWAYERYSVRGRLQRMAFDDTNTYGVMPLLYIDNTYGVTVGGRFVHRNLIGERERFAFRAGFGGEFNEFVDATFKTGERFGQRTELELHGEHERRPHDPFYGIGNNDDAVEVRHRQQMERVTGTLDFESTQYFSLRMAAALTDLEYGVADEGPAIDVMYPPDMLTGWTGTRNVYGELELRYDSRRVSASLEHKGVLLDAFAGRVYQLEAGNDYWRYGGEAIHFMPLGIGRTIATRLHLESVSGSLDDVAFTQLPQLGGKSLLRGYDADRFRDRAAVATSAEYFWDLSSFMLASVFVDVGRVYSGIDDLSLHNLRVGYGAGVQLVDDRRFLAGVSVATSIDGGVFVNLVLDPIYEPEPRVRQK
ncbi:MAG TPA: BamA/TamA family outer membrane protein [Kofleriaceae bacterium]